MGRADSCQGICLLIVIPWHMEKLAPLKVTTELLYEEAVARHVCIFGVPVARRLLDHQVRVTIAQDPANAEFLGKTESMYECLILCYIVGGGKMDLQHIFELVAFGRGEDDVGS